MDTKDEILKNALKLFATNGLEGVSTRDIASSTNLSQSTLYKHFDNKEAIFTALKKGLAKLMLEHDNSFSFLNDKENNQLSDSQITIEDIMNYTHSLFNFWTENDFAINYRKLIAIEQYKNETNLKEFNRYFGKDIIERYYHFFNELGLRSSYESFSLELLAIQFISPIINFIFIYDDKKENRKQLINNHLNLFVNILGDEQNNSLISLRKVCNSCGMVMKEPADFAASDTSKDYCVYCSDENGELQSFEQRQKALTEFIARTKRINHEQALIEANQIMSQMPAWQAYFTN